MIDTERSRPDLYRIVVPIADFHFPSECILCGKKEAHPVTITSEKIKVFLVAHSSKTDTFSTNLCQDHASDYVLSVRKKKIIFNSVAITGLVLGFGPAYLYEKQLSTGAAPLWVHISMGAGVLLIISAYALMKMKRSTFPIQVESIRSGLMTGYTHFVFTFPDQASMDRFVMANQEPA